MGVSSFWIHLPSSRKPSLTTMWNVRRKQSSGIRQMWLESQFSSFNHSVLHSACVTGQALFHVLKMYCEQSPGLPCIFYSSEKVNHNSHNTNKKTI